MTIRPWSSPNQNRGYGARIGRLILTMWISASAPRSKRFAGASSMPHGVMPSTWALVTATEPNKVSWCGLNATRCGPNRPN